MNPKVNEKLLRIDVPEGALSAVAFGIDTASSLQ
jgi:hypothetical protein